MFFDMFLQILCFSNSDLIFSSINLFDRTVSIDLFDYGLYEKPATVSVVEFKNLMLNII